MPRRDWTVFTSDVPIACRVPKDTEAMRERARLEAEWQASQATYEETPRTPEAVCRGYQGRDAKAEIDWDAPLCPAPFQPGDERIATSSWLRLCLSQVRDLTALWDLELPRATRASWRAGMAAMIGRPRGTVICPGAYLAYCVEQVEHHGREDLRCRPGNFASDTWPDHLASFALVPLPKRRP